MPDEYTTRFTEVNRVDQLKYPQTLDTGVHDCGWWSMRDYARACFLISVGNIAAAATFDAWLIQAQDDAGTGLKTISGCNITDLDGTDDNAMIAIELRTEELDVDNGFDYISLRIHCEGQSTVDAKLIRRIPRYAPVGTTQFTEVVNLS